MLEVATSRHLSYGAEEEDREGDLDELRMAESIKNSIPTVENEIGRPGVAKSVT
jgi:hypothetical protein